MTDSNKINFSQPQVRTDTNSSPTNKPNPTEAPSTQANNLAKQVQIDNRSVFKTPSLSQEQITQSHNNKESRDKDFNIKSNSNSETGLKIDYQIQSKNPLVAAQLQNPNSKTPSKIKNKKTPPEAKSSTTGKAINPRKVKPSIPGRLQASFDIKQKPIERFIEAVDIAAIESKESEKAQSIISESSFAELLGWGNELFELDQEQIITQLRSADLEEYPELQAILGSIIQELEDANTDDIRLLAMLKLYSPIPFPYIIQEVDEFFDDDEEELQGKRKSKRANPEDEEEEEDTEFDSSISMSVTTINFNKIHFIINYSSSTNSMELQVIGDPIGMELLIPIETILESELGDQLNSMNQVLKTWHDNVLRITDSRILKLKSTGRLDPKLSQACVSILQTINQSDIDLSDDDSMDSSYV